MIEVMPESQGNVIGVKFSGKITAREYEETIIPRLEAAERGEFNEFDLWALVAQASRLCWRRLTQDLSSEQLQEALVWLKS